VAFLDLVAFDVDGTLIRDGRDRTVWEILNERFTGRSDVNAERFGRYRRGEISYAEWVELDISGWRDAGAVRDDLIASFATLGLVPGTRETLARLLEEGMRLVAISGTLDLMLATVFPDHPFHEVYTNHIGFDEEGRIRHWRATPFDVEGKAEGLRAIAAREGISLRRCAFVGDSSNDVWIARAVGLAIAFNPKSSELEEVADVVVRDADLRAVLPYLLGDRLPPQA
jgi:phosphoserine phosphatase